MIDQIQSLDLQLRKVKKGGGGGGVPQNWDQESQISGLKNSIKNPMLPLAYVHLDGVEAGLWTGGIWTGIWTQF